MGWRTVADVRDFSKATGTTFAVAVMLAERAPDETRIARPGIDRLAQDSRCDRRTAQRALRRLEEMGEIEVMAYERGGRGMATEYRILIGLDEKGRQSAAVSKRAASDPERAASRPEKGGTAPPLPKGTEENRTTPPDPPRGEQPSRPKGRRRRDPHERITEIKA